MNPARHWRACSMQRRTKKKNQRRQWHDFVGKALGPSVNLKAGSGERQPERLPYNNRKQKRKLSGLMAISLNSAKAFGGGNGRKQKWQIQINWWNSSATCPCWRLLDWLSSLKRNGV